MAISIFEAGEEAGVGMPYSDEFNSRLMLANIASIEIPPLCETYLSWLRSQSSNFLNRYGVDKDSLHERQFLPRILLGQYFRDQLLELVKSGNDSGFEISITENCKIIDIEASHGPVRLWSEQGPVEDGFDMAVIATGHVWPEGDDTPRSFFPSPWSGMLDAEIPATSVGIMGTSLSAIDAAMAVAAQHGKFREEDDESLSFEPYANSEGLLITLMSRSGILPEADFYCPIPYQPLSIATDVRVTDEIMVGSNGLLNRLFKLVQEELLASDPQWAGSIGLSNLDADSFCMAYFTKRLEHDPFRWAAYNLREVERNKRDKITVPWRYTILRLHEAIQDAVPHLDEADRKRFDAGLCRVFVDNYAAVPSETIRRLLALRASGLIEVVELGSDYEMIVTANGTIIVTDSGNSHYDVFIDARGQKPLRTDDLPFPQLRQQLLDDEQEHPVVGDDYTLMSPPTAQGRIALGAIPYLVHDQPFIQGITASAEIGRSIANAATASGSRRRRQIIWYDN